MVERIIEQKDQDTKLSGQEREERNRSRCQRIDGRKAVAKEVDENAINRKHQDRVQKETTVVSATMKVRVET